MERRMTVFASEMSEYNFDSLCRIIREKYKKFKIFYRLVEEYSESIKKLKYEESETNTLDVSLKLSDECDAADFASRLNDKIISNNIACTVLNEGKKIIVSVLAD